MSDDVECGCACHTTMPNMCSHCALPPIDFSERDRLLAIAEWAQDAPHHHGCGIIRGGVLRCTCGRDEAFAPSALGFGRP